MITIKRTNSDNPHFEELVKLLDLELKERDGDEDFFIRLIKPTHLTQLAGINTITHYILVQSFWCNAAVYFI